MTNSQPTILPPLSQPTISANHQWPVTIFCLSSTTHLMHHIPPSRIRLLLIHSSPSLILVPLDLSLSNSSFSKVPRQLHPSLPYCCFAFLAVLGAMLRLRPL
jgi:hypothetical protein